MDSFPHAHAVAPAKWRDSSSDLFKRVRDAEFCSDRVRRWRSDLDVICDAVSSLYVHRQVYTRLGGIIAANPALQRPNLFLGELLEWYVITNAVLAERDAQQDSGVVSLANVLHEIARHHEDLDRKSFRKMHTGLAYVPPQRQDALGDNAEHDEVMLLLEPLYDKFSSPQDSQTLDLAMVRADILNLRAAAKSVTTFRNEIIGHRARHVSIDSISVGAIHSYIDTLEQLARKYHQLMFGAASWSLDPMVHEEWVKIFRFPWIQPEEKGYAVPYAATLEVAVAIANALRPDERDALLNILSSQGHAPAGDDK